MRAAFKAMACAFALGGASLHAQAPVVGTTAGAVRGTAEEGLSVFRGIPYAQAPTGNLRWADPRPARPWRGVKDATRFSLPCAQAPSAAFGPYTPEFLVQGKTSEDCLYLNVWAPRPAGRKPVYVYIHGGGFGTGAGSLPVYDGAGLARRGVVVVTINYRLGIFGFLAHPALTAESKLHTSGNYGILDMIEALRWVKANIARFGGDPRNVTIAGQSAGAAAVNDLILSPPARGLFAKAIAESGSGMGINMFNHAEAERYGVAMADRLGARSVADLRRLGAAELNRATTVNPLGHAGGKGGPPPIWLAPNDDGIVVRGNPDRPRDPVQSAVPLITGYNADEGMGRAATVAQFERMVRTRYGDHADRFLALYPHATDAEAAASSQLMAADRYLANAMIWAEARENSSGQAIFLYHFTHPYPAGSTGSFGAFHTAEVPYVMGALDNGTRAFTREDRAVSRVIQDFWLNFMRTGAPGAAGFVQWHRFDPSAGNSMQIAVHPRAGLSVSSAERLAAFRAYVAAGGQLSLF